MSLTTREVRTHPISELLIAASNGRRGLPTHAELAAIPSSYRERIERACREVAAIAEEGWRERARVRALDRAGAIISSLPVSLQENWPAESDDPGELAELVATSYRRFA